jgi:hypothetical protein
LSFYNYVTAFTCVWKNCQSHNGNSWPFLVYNKVVTEFSPTFGIFPKSNSKRNSALKTAMWFRNKFWLLAMRFFNLTLALLRLIFKCVRVASSSAYIQLWIVYIQPNIWFKKKKRYEKQTLEIGYPYFFWDFK